MSTVQASGTSSVAPLYPTSAPTIHVVDVPNLTVLQVVRKLPITSRFSMLLNNTSVGQGLVGGGPYTVFAPADNYFDYLPRGAYVALTRAQERELAEHLVVSHVAVGETASSEQYVTLAQDTLPVTVKDASVKVGDGFAILGYRAKNGIVYVINKVLPPDDLMAVLQVP